MEVRVLWAFVRWCGDCLTRRPTGGEARGVLGFEGARVAACPGPDVHPRASIVVQELVIAG